ncbi:MAG: glucose-6-phosphate dehydrogenase assembly protein OpcA, partial [Dehalococcoidia bacterium]
MTTESELQLLATWHQEPTSVSEIDKALAGIWQGVQKRSDEATDEGEIDPHPVITRTSVMNLLVYSASRGVSERAASAITHLGGTHPSRSILIVGEPADPTSSLGASIAAHCFTVGPQGRGFCFEQIDLTARGEVIGRLPGIVTQLLVHDLPTLLWWPGDPPLSDPFFTAMTGVCDRLIVDSSDFSDPEGELQRLADFARMPHGPCGVSDLNWDRLADWREILAQFFDAAPMRPYLHHVEAVQIDYAFDP